MCACQVASSTRLYLIYRLAEGHVRPSEKEPWHFWGPRFMCLPHTVNAKNAVLHVSCCSLASCRATMWHWYAVSLAKSFSLAWMLRNRPAMSHPQIELAVERLLCQDTTAVTTQTHQQKLLKTSLYSPITWPTPAISGLTMLSLGHIDS